MRHPKHQLRRNAGFLALRERGPLIYRSRKVLGRWEDEGEEERGYKKMEEGGKKVADGETWSTLFGSELIGESLAGVL